MNRNAPPEITREFEDYLYSKEARWKKVARIIIPLKQRTILGVLTFIGLLIGYAMRTCLSLTIVSMVEYKQKENNTNPDECPFVYDGYYNDVIENNPILDWTEQECGIVLASFYVGNFITYVPGGILSDLLGGKHVITFSIFLSALITLITPLAITQGGLGIFICTRVIMGIIQGTMFPAASVLMASWIPRTERKWYGALIFSSSLIGSILGYTISGAIVYHYKSWFLVFYTFGVVGLVWCVIFNLLCTSSPYEHPYISEEEQMFLLEKIGVIGRTSRITEAPWKPMFKNGALIALIFAQLGEDFAFFMLVIDLPKYYGEVLHLDIQLNGLLSALPFLAMLIVSYLSGFLGDWILINEKMSVTACRKLFTGLSSFFPAVGLVLASYSGCNPYLSVAAFTFAAATMGFHYYGTRINGVDLSPRYGGTVMGYVKGVGAIMGFIAPYLCALLTPNTTVYEYRIVFWITIALLVVTSVIYLQFGSGEIQPFNEIRSSKK